MKPLMILTLSCLLVPSAFPQRHEGGRAGRVTARPTGRVRGSIRSLGPNGYGNRGFYGGYYWPFNEYAPQETYQPAEPSGSGVMIVNPAAGEPAQVERPARLVIHEYNRPEDYGLPGEHTAGEQADESRPSLYLIAFRDNTIRAASTYWVEGNTLHYLDRDHRQNQAPLSSVDRDLSAQLNGERHVPFNLQ